MLPERNKENGQNMQNKPANNNKDSVDNLPSSQTNRLFPPPISVTTTKEHNKSVFIDGFEKGADERVSDNLDYYEEIRKKPISKF